MESYGYAVWAIAAKKLTWHRNHNPNRTRKVIQQDILAEKNKFWEGDDSFKVNKIILI